MTTRCEFCSSTISMRRVVGLSLTRSPPRSASSVSRSKRRSPTLSTRGVSRQLRAPHQRLQPRVEFGQRERLDQVVVGAGLEAFDLVRQQILGGQHQHRHPRAAGLAQLAAQRQAVEPGQHAGRARSRRRDCRAPSAARSRRRARARRRRRAPRSTRRCWRRCRVVFDQQQVHGCR